MSVNLTNSIMNIYRDEADNFFTYIGGYVFNMKTKERENKFYLKRKIKFMNGKDVRNKSKIKVIDGFMSPSKIKYKNDEGRYEMCTIETYFINDFELLEDGIDEKQKVFQPRKDKEKAPKQDKNEDKLNSFSFNDYSGVTPF